MVNTASRLASVTTFCGEDNKPLGSVKEGISCNVIYYHVFKEGSFPGRYEHVASVSID
jgi:hypothetical protein